jgi:cytochrome b
VIVVALAATIITGESERDIHVSAGTVILVLILWRVVWGFEGPAYARFSNFVKAPAIVLAYVKAVIARREKRYLGHNPAGGSMVILLLLLLAATGATGVLLTTDAFWGSSAMDAAHEVLSDLTLICVTVHALGVIFTSVRSRENLIVAMVTGYKRETP